MFFSFYIGLEILFVCVYHMTLHLLFLHCASCLSLIKNDIMH